MVSIYGDATLSLFVFLLLFLAHLSSQDGLIVFTFYAARKSSVVRRAPFLAHLSRRLEGELIVYPWSGVRPSSSVVVRRRPKFQT